MGSLPLVDILAGTLHDLRNVMSWPHYHVEMLQTEATLSEEGKQHCRQLAYQLELVDHHLSVCLGLYRAQQDNLQGVDEEHLLVDTCEEFAQLFVSVLEDKQLTFSMSVPEGLLWFFDKELLRMWVNNAMFNAVKYAKSRVSLEVFVQDETLHLIIEDDGKGFSDLMLEAFVQRENIRGESGTISGLGLHFSRAIAEQCVHNGRKGEMQIDNRGKLGGGRLTLSLP